MDRTTLENDLIDLLDGRLPPERAKRVREALSSDPALHRLVERMAADRRGLGRLRQADEHRERARTEGVRDAVRAAVEAAERDGLLGHRAQARGKRNSGRHLVAAAALVGVLTLVVGVSLLLGFKGDRLAESVIGGRPGVRGVVKQPEARYTDAEPASAGGEVGPVGPSGEAGKPSQAMALAEDQGRRVSRELAEDRRRLDSWLADATSRVGGDPLLAWRALPSAEETEAALARSRTGELSIEDAAILAFTHRLRVVVPAAQGDPTAEKAREAFSGKPVFAENASASSSSVVIGATQARAIPAAGRSWSMDVRASLDPERAAVRGALAEIVAKVVGSGLEKPRFEVAEVDPAAALPAVTIDDVLWWTHPASEWSREVSLRVDVVVK
jgi:hypothetical protein